MRIMTHVARHEDLTPICRGMGGWMGEHMLNMCIEKGREVDGLWAFFASEVGRGRFFPGV